MYPRFVTDPLGRHEAEIRKAAYQQAAVAPALEALWRKDRFTLPELAEAAGAAAQVIEEEGAEENAEALRKITAEATELTQSPNVEKAERMLERLALQVAALMRRVEDNEAQRQRDRKEETAFAVYLFMLGLFARWRHALSRRRVVPVPAGGHERLAVGDGLLVALVDGTDA